VSFAAITLCVASLTSVYCCCLFRHRLSPVTFGYNLVREIIKMDLKLCVYARAGFNWLTTEHGNEPVDFIKCGEFFEWLSDYIKFSRKTLLHGVRK
jgi:hypothetical protein